MLLFSVGDMLAKVLFFRRFMAPRGRRRRRAVCRHCGGRWCTGGEELSIEAEEKEDYHLVSREVSVPPLQTFFLLVRNETKAVQLILRQHFCDLPLFDNLLHCHCQNQRSLQCLAANCYLKLLIAQSNCFWLLKAGGVVGAKCCLGIERVYCIYAKHEWGSAVLELRGYNRVRTVRSIFRTCIPLGLQVKVIHGGEFAIITGPWTFLWWPFFSKQYYTNHVARKKSLHS